MRIARIRLGLDTIGDSIFLSHDGLCLARVRRASPILWQPRSVLAGERLLTFAVRHMSSLCLPVYRVTDAAGHVIK